MFIVLFCVELKSYSPEHDLLHDSHQDLDDLEGTHSDVSDIDDIMPVAQDHWCYS